MSKKNSKAKSNKSVDMNIEKEISRLGKARKCEYTTPSGEVINIKYHKVGLKDVERLFKEKPLFRLGKEDRRYKEYKKFQKKHGFNRECTWNLDVEIIAFILPRLIQYKKDSIAYPGKMEQYPDGYLTYETWLDYVGVMIYGFYMDYMLKYEWEDTPNEVKLAIELGKLIFTDYFDDLNW